MTLMISDSLTQPLPHPHFVPLPVPALQTPQEVREHLTDIYNALSQPRQVEFQDVARQHPGWASDMAKAHPFMVAIHEKFQPMQEVTPPQLPHNPWDAAPIPAPTPQPAAVPAAIAPAAPVQMPPAAPVHATPVPTTPSGPVPVTAVPPLAQEVDAPEQEAETDEPETPADTEPVDDTDGVEASTEPEHEVTPSIEPLVLEVAANPNGLFSQLHVICGEGGNVGLLVRREGQKLQVILTPSGVKGEQGKDLAQVMVTATPEELDAEFALALTDYAAQRQVQTQKALSVAQQVRQSAQKKPTTTPSKTAAAPKTSARKPEGILQVSVSAAAKLTLKGDSGKAEVHDVGPDHRDLKLKPGKYKLSIQADGYLTQTQDVTIQDGETSTVQLALVNAGLGF